MTAQQEKHMAWLLAALCVVAVVMSVLLLEHGNQPGAVIVLVMAWILGINSALVVFGGKPWSL